MKTFDMLWKIGQPHSGPATIAGIRCRPKVRVRVDGKISQVTIHTFCLPLDDEARLRIEALGKSGDQFDAVIGQAKFGWFVGKFRVWRGASTDDVRLFRNSIVKNAGAAECLSTCLRSSAEIRFVPA